MDGVLTLGVSAFGLGVLHALEPGHGKTLMVGALVNSKRKWLDPIILAFSTALGHMAGILLFTVISFSVVHEFIAPELKFYLEFSIGLAILIIGCILFYKNCGESHHTRSCSCCTSAKMAGRNINSSSKHLSIVGILVGLIPCPSALALASSTSLLGSLPQAISIAFIFGAGVAFSLLLIGVAITHLVQGIKVIPNITRFSRFSKFIAPLSLVVLGIILLLHTGSHHH
jgi:nickel/cobalt exporter